MKEFFDNCAVDCKSQDIKSYASYLYCKENKLVQCNFYTQIIGFICKMRGGIMNKFIGELEDGSGKLYESEYKQKFILSNDGSKVMLVLDDKSERVESIEEQRKYFEEHQDEFAERIRRYNSGIVNVR